MHSVCTSLPSLGPSSSNPSGPTKLYPSFNFSAFQSVTAVAVACFPRHDSGELYRTVGLRRHVPVVVRRFIHSGCLRDGTRYSRSYSTNRYSRSRTTHRHSSSRCCSSGKPHGLWETPPFRVQSYGINANYESADYKNSQRMAAMPPPAMVVSQSPQSQ